MALPGSGAIAASDINVELGYSSTAQWSINDSAARSLAGVSGAGTQISFSNFYGKSSSFTFNQTISSNTTDYNLKSAAIAAGWNQSSPLIASITINSGVYVYASSTGTYAFDTGSTFPSGTTLALTNNGTIIGKGGAGGTGGTWQSPGQGGSAAGPAFIARAQITVTNNGTIAGGGGGGGGGGNSNL